MTSFAKCEPAKGSWCGFASVDVDGTVLSSAGVASVVAGPTGCYTVTLTTPMPSTNYPVLATVAETPSEDSIEIHYDILSPSVIKFTIHEGDNGTAANTPRDRAFSFGIPCGDADGVPCDCPDVDVPNPATSAPIPDNETDTAIRTGQIGTSLDYARADHNHPIRRQGNPGDPAITAGGNMTVAQSIILDRWSTEESYSYRFRVRGQQAAGAGWGWLTVPAIAGFQQPKIGAVGTYRFPSTAVQDDDGSFGAAPRGPFMGAEAHHWSSTNRIYGGYFRRDNAVDQYIEFTVDYVRT